MLQRNRSEVVSLAQAEAAFVEARLDLRLRRLESQFANLNDDIDDHDDSLDEKAINLEAYRLGMLAIGEVVEEQNKLIGQLERRVHALEYRVNTLVTDLRNSGIPNVGV